MSDNSDSGKSAQRTRIRWILEKVGRCGPARSSSLVVVLVLGLAQNGKRTDLYERLETSEAHTVAFNFDYDNRYVAFLDILGF